MINIFKMQERRVIELYSIYLRNYNKTIMNRVVPESIKIKQSNFSDIYIINAKEIRQGGNMYTAGNNILKEILNVMQDLPIEKIYSKYYTIFDGIAEMNADTEHNFVNHMHKKSIGNQVTVDANTINELKKIYISLGLENMALEIDKNNRRRMCCIV